MPYNNTPIAPSDDVTGTVSLPLARVKKIISSDEDLGPCSNNAAFAIDIATELFVQHLVRQAYNVVKSEKKPRRNLQYSDVASVINRTDNLEFLADVVPRTIPYKKYKEQKARAEQAASDKLSNGQRTLDQITRAEVIEDSPMPDQLQENPHVSEKPVVERLESNPEHFKDEPADP